MTLNKLVVPLSLDRPFWTGVIVEAVIFDAVAGVCQAVGEFAEVSRQK